MHIIGYSSHCCLVNVLLLQQFIYHLLGFWYCFLQLAWTPKQAVAYGRLHQYNITQSMKVLFQVNLICKLFTNNNDIAMEVQVRANFHQHPIPPLFYMCLRNVIWILKILPDQRQVFVFMVSEWQNALLHFDPKSDGAWISLFKLTKNHKDTFFFCKCGQKRR